MLSHLSPLPDGPQLPGGNNSLSGTNVKLMKIANFWKLKKQFWNPPSGLVKSFQHIFSALVHVRDLNSNADVALERFFPDGAVQYVFGTAVGGLFCLTKSCLLDLLLIVKWCVTFL